MTLHRDLAADLEGDTVKEVRYATAAVLIVGFESGKVLRVYDASWDVTDEEAVE